MRSPKRIINIYQLEGYTVYCLFSNGESRFIDFKKLFKKWKVSKDDIEFPLTKSIKKFQEVKVIDGTLTWENIKIDFKDENSNSIELNYDIDPIVLYEASEIDHNKNIQIGAWLRKARRDAGLTQVELAEKIGVSKHYISRIENNKTGVEFSTIIKIIQGGLEKNLQLSIV